MGRGSLRLGRGKEISGSGGGDKGGLLTLIGGLRCLRDIHGQLSTEGIHAHHSRMDRGVREGRELAVVARDAVQSLCDVSRSLQNNLLKSNRNIPFNCPSHSPGSTTSRVYCRLHSGLSMIDCTNFCNLFSKPVCSVSSSSSPYLRWAN